MKNITVAPSIRILVPVMLTAESCLALPEAVRLAQRRHGEIILFHVVKLNIVGEERGIPLGNLRQKLREDAGAMLQQLAAEFSDSGISIATKIAEGNAGDEIAKEANVSEADLIVMCMRKHRRLLKWFRRDTAKYVIQNSACPVWLVAPQQSDGTLIRVMTDSVKTDECEQLDDAYEHLQASASLFRVQIS